MEPPIPLFDTLATTSFWWGLLKLAYLFAFGLYTLFSLVVLVQINQMVKAVRNEFNGVISLLGWIHVAVAVGAFVLAVVIL